MLDALLLSGISFHPHFLLFTRQMLHHHGASLITSFIAPLNPWLERPVAWHTDNHTLGWFHGSSSSRQLQTWSSSAGSVCFQTSPYTCRAGRWWRLQDTASLSPLRRRKTVSCCSAGRCLSCAWLGWSAWKHNLSKATCGSMLSQQQPTL